MSEVEKIKPSKHVEVVDDGDEEKKSGEHHKAKAEEAKTTTKKKHHGTKLKELWEAWIETPKSLCIYKKLF